MDRRRSVKLLFKVVRLSSVFFLFILAGRPFVNSLKQQGRRVEEFLEKKKKRLSVKLLARCPAPLTYRRGARGKEKFFRFQIKFR